VSEEAWHAMDDWCRKRSADLLQTMEPYIMGGGSTDDAQYRQQLGQSQAYAAMRSFIHGALTTPNESTPHHG